MARQAPPVDGLGVPRHDAARGWESSIRFLSISSAVYSIKDKNYVVKDLENRLYGRPGGRGWSRDDLGDGSGVLEKTPPTRRPAPARAAAKTARVCDCSQKGVDCPCKCGCQSGACDCGKKAACPARAVVKKAAHCDCSQKGVDCPCKCGCDKSGACDCGKNSKACCGKSDCGKDGACECGTAASPGEAATKLAATVMMLAS